MVRKNSKKKSTASTRKMTSIAKRVLNKSTETKRMFSTLDEVALTHVGQAQFYDPIQISQGSGVHNRIGNEIRLSGFHFKGVLNNNYDGVNYVRMALFYYKDQANLNTASEMFDALGGAATSTTTTTGLNSIYYPFNKNKIQILHNKVFKLGASTSTDGSSTRFFNTFVKLHGKKIIYRGNNTGADNCTPRLHLGLWVADASDDFPAGTVEVSGVLNTWYKDL